VPVEVVGCLEKHHRGIPCPSSLLVELSHGPVDVDVAELLGS